LWSGNKNPVTLVAVVVSRNVLVQVFDCFAEISPKPDDPGYTQCHVKKSEYRQTRAHAIAPHQRLVFPFGFLVGKFSVSRHTPISSANPGIVAADKTRRNSFCHSNEGRHRHRHPSRCCSFLSSGTNISSLR
jgi:hypothetical protein